MIETDNLRTASLYINNQLLSRGLLRDGQTIDFADPGQDGAPSATMSRIMSVVNDLILRRDRDAEHRESLSATLRTVRAESLRQTNDLQRLHEKHAEAQRKVNIGDATEASLRSQLKAADASIHKLKDEAAKTKVLVAQTRAACANEVRKRDRQIDGLKKAVTDAGRSRGERKGPGITTITVTGEIGAEMGGHSSPQGTTDDDSYDLRTETNAFLAELARGLSEDNEKLVELVRRTSQSLTAMSGFTAGANGDGHAVSLTTNCDELALEMEAILEHLRTILTNPSFVPLEEVVVREDEIHRLRDGWEKMEDRWKEAVHLIDGWRRRMIVSGRPVNMEELKMGLRLSPVRVRDVEETSQGLGLRLSTLEEEAESAAVESPSPAESLHLVPAPGYEEPEESDSESSMFEEDVDLHELDVEEPNVQILEQSIIFHSVDSSPLPVPPQLSPLKDSDSAGNRGQSGSNKARRRPGDFATIVEENTRDLAQVSPAEPPKRGRKPQQPLQQKLAKPTCRQVPPEDPRPNSAASQVSNGSVDSVLLVKASQPSSTSQTLTKPTKSSSLKQRQQPEAAVKQPPRPISQASNKSDSQRQNRQDNDSPGSKASASEMPPPPVPNKKAPADTPRNRSPAKPSSRLPLPRTGGNNLPPPQQSPLNMAAIAAKLAASERDADAARVRAKLKAARLGKRPLPMPPATSSSANNNNGISTSSTATTASGRTVSGSTVASVETDVTDDSALDPVKKPLPPPTRDEEDELLGRSSGGGAGVRSGAEDNVVNGKTRKRDRRVSKVVSRRRSTLNPWELESLMTGGVAQQSPAR